MESNVLSIVAAIVITAIVVYIFLPRRVHVEEIRYRDRPPKRSDRPLSDGEMRRRLDRLDLSSVEQRLKEKRWSARRIKSILIEYRKFLYLFGTGTNLVVPWSADLDEVWHVHILQMRKYAEDCQMLFGEVLFHDTTVSKGTDRHRHGTSETNAAYRKAFEPGPGTDLHTAHRYRSDSSDLLMPFPMWVALHGSPSGAETTGGSDHGRRDTDKQSGVGCGGAPFVVSCGGGARHSSGSDHHQSCGGNSQTSCGGSSSSCGGGD